METRKTFVRVKGPQHFEQVIAAYRKAGAQQCHSYFAKPTYIRCDAGNMLFSGDDNVIAGYTKGYTELILRNGSLVPAVDPVDWTERYVKVNNKAEYDAAITAFVKLTGRPIIGGEVEGPDIPGYVGASRITGKIRSSSEATLVCLIGSEAPLTDLLKAAGIELPKPKDRRTRITYNEYPDGSREITNIENCLTREECNRIAPGYLDGTPCYYLDGKDIVLNGGHEFRFRANSKVLHDNVQDNAQIDSDFWPAFMRRAGERFVACKKAAAEKAAAEKAKPKIVEVVI